MSGWVDPVVFEGPCLHRGGYSRISVAPFKPGYWVRASSRARPIRITPRRYRPDRLTSALHLDDGPPILCPEHILAACVLTGLGAVCITLEAGPREFPVGPNEGSFTESLYQGTDAATEVVVGPMILRPVILRPTQEHWSFTARVGGPPNVRVSWDQGATGAATAEVGPLVDVSQLCELGRSRTFLVSGDLPSVLSLGRYRGHAEAAPWIRMLRREDLCRPDQLQESARHKIYDLIGDLAALGGIPIGSIQAVNPGHANNARIRAALAEAGLRR
jgi:UDP-3-O-acyl-N-acetylglucosamine deacetylase